MRERFDTGRDNSLLTYCFGACAESVSSCLEFDDVAGRNLELKLIEWLGS